VEAVSRNLRVGTEENNDSSQDRRCPGLNLIRAFTEQKVESLCTGNIFTRIRGHVIGNKKIKNETVLAN
jgi:hypothetical protein